MEREQIDDFKENVKKNWLVMSRVSPNVRESFIALSNQEFCGDYGQCLGFLFQQTMEYQQLKSIFLNEESLRNFVSIINKEQKLPGNNEIKLLSGKVLNRK